MKRRAKPLVWLFPLFASVLVYFFVRIFDLRPAAVLKKTPEPAARSSAPLTPPSKKINEPPGPKAAIIIDDIGYNLEAVETAYGLGRPLTLAILPDASLAGEAAKLASTYGLEIMLHLPFESAEEKNGTNAFEGTISAGMSPAEIRAAVARGLDRIPGAAGVNNHTGSSATEETRLMRPVFEVLKSRGLYFVDSRTTAETVAYKEAVLAGVRSASRDVFIDADPSEARIAARLRELFSLAKKNGRAVGICHPKRESLAALARHIGLAEAYGVRLVFASAIVE
jgi:hypothetical protein